MSDCVETMVSANGETPWHKKGVVLSGYPDLETMYTNSGLDWNVDTAPLYYRDNAGDEVTAKSVYGLVRDVDKSLLGVCTERYTPYQNREAFDWCKPLIDSKFWKMETAGSLKEGKVCWALLQHGIGEVMKGDKLRRYLLLQWGHTGHDSIRCGLTSIRVVCNNTLQQALSKDVMHNIKHNTAAKLKLAEVRELYDAARVEFERQQEKFKEFLDVPVDKSIKEWYIESLLNSITAKPDIGLKDSEEVKKAKMRRWEAMRQRKSDMIHLYIEQGSGQKELGITNNLWGLFNGAEEFLEKCNGGGRVVDRGWNILRGNGLEQVNRAFSLAEQVMAMV